MSQAAETRGCGAVLWKKPPRFRAALRLALRAPRAASRGAARGNGLDPASTPAMTPQQKRNLMIGAAGIGAVVLAQALRRRSDYDFAKKSVVITGGSRGLGLVMARELAHQGARLTLVARSDEELDRAVDDIRARQPFAEVLPGTGDVRSRHDAERAVAQAY